jgi:calcineurin-like phosphoesterase family protein
MNIFFTSDVHFGHTNIIKYCNRPFTNVETMDDAIVHNWNSTVGPNDVVYHLGDWAFHNYHMIGELRGNIFSIPGNHDLEREKKILPYLTNGFLPEIHYVKLDKTHRFVLCHYPFETWRREYTYHLHGHTHGTAGVKRNRLDVGMDAMKEFRPIHVDEILDRMKTNNIWAEEMNK